MIHHLYLLIVPAVLVAAVATVYLVRSSDIVLIEEPDQYDDQDDDQDDRQYE